MNQFNTSTIDPIDGRRPVPTQSEPPQAGRSGPRVFDRGEPASTDPDLLARLQDMRSRLKDGTPQDWIAAALLQEFKGRICVVSSFGAESAVLLHMIASIDPTVPVLFLNTGKLFGETLRYRDALQERLGLTDIRAIRPHPEDEMRLDPDGVLWSKDANACCHFRKVLPLQRAIAGFEAEITGRKRFQTRARSALSPVELNGRRFVFNPLAAWSLEQLASYAHVYRLPQHPLVADGFLSIGCMPCTSKVKAGEDYRSGRWAGSDKEECGIHENLAGDGI